MNYVEPIRDPHILKMMANDFKNEKNPRNYMLFMCGIYLGRRITDTLKLQAKDLKDKDFVYVRESKTGKKYYCLSVKH
ncbi:MAG: hypothetical protein ACM3TR_11575 [Caulobacteraceae bacterium]